MRQENVTCPTCGDTVTVGVVLTEVEPSMLPEEAGEMPSPIEEITVECPEGASMTTGTAGR